MRYLSVTKQLKEKNINKDIILIQKNKFFRKIILHYLLLVS